jgi:hypothetical protein
MPYSNSAAVSRPEITAFVEEAINVEHLFIGQQVLPPVPVEARASRYPRMRIQNGELLKTDVTRRGPTGTYNEVSRKFDWDVYDTEEFGLEERIDDTIVEEMSRFFDVEATTTKLVMRSMMIDYELRVAGTIFNTSNFNATAASAAYTVANKATLDAAQDINDALLRLQQKGVIPNTLIMSRQVFNRIRTSDLLQKYLIGLNSNLGQQAITSATIGAAFDIPNVLIAAPAYDTSAKGKAPSLTPIWSNNYMWLGNVQGGDFVAGGAGRTLVWQADVPGGLFATETYRNEDRRGDMVRVRSYHACKIVDGTSGELITTSYA